MLAPHTPTQSHLLAALPDADYGRLLPHLELTPLELGWALYESGSQQDYVYFPTASILQAAGSIHYSRGKITVLDRPKLEARVCECYAVVKREYGHLLSRNTAIVGQLS